MSYREFTIHLSRGLCVYGIFSVVSCAVGKLGAVGNVRLWIVW